MARTWPGHERRFPGMTRRLTTAYAALRAGEQHRLLLRASGARVWLGAEITGLDGGGVSLRDGRRLTADVVVDGRGATAMTPCA